MAPFALLLLAGISAAGAVFERQLPGLPDPAVFPPVCGSSCEAVIGPLLTCATFSCFCTAADVNALADCLQCVVDLGGGVTKYQRVLDQAEAACDQRGFSVPADILSPAATLAAPTSSSLPIFSTESVALSSATSTTSLLTTSTTTTSTSVPVTTITVLPSTTSTDGGVTAVPSLAAGVSKHRQWNYILLPTTLFTVLGVFVGSAVQLF